MKQNIHWVIVFLALASAIFAIFTSLIAVNQTHELQRTISSLQNQLTEQSNTWIEDKESIREEITANNLAVLELYDNQEIMSGIFESIDLGSDDQLDVQESSIEEAVVQPVP